MSCNSKSVNAPNCSIVRVVDNEVYYLGTRIFYTIPIKDDILENLVFFIQQEDSGRSLNQSIGEPGSIRTIRLGVNTAMEVISAFQEIDKENIQKIQKLFM